MPIRVKCGGCKKTLSVKDHLAGKKIKCPVCQTVVVVAAPASPQAGATPPTGKPVAPPKSGGPQAKPGVATKATPEKPHTNGSAAPDAAGKNGTPAPVELPPENVEAEALAAFAEETKPVEEEVDPQFIEFKCDWCDEIVKLPMDLAGKQAQCPNPECKRVVKVPLPKKAEKKDWRKMDRKGPAAALVNQPEQLDDAWGTQDATRARQDSLKQAGVLVEPVKRPVGVIGWAFRAFYALCVLVLVGFAGIGISRLVVTKQHLNALKEAESLVAGGEAARIKQPLLVGEAHRTIALLYLREGKALKAKDYFQSALAAATLEIGGVKGDGINDQLFLIDLAVAQVELGGEGDEILSNAKRKLDWEATRGELEKTIAKIKEPEVQTLALREVGTRLFEKKQPNLAVGLASKFAKPAGKALAPQRQLIAFLCEMPGQEDKLASIAKRPVASKDPPDSHARVGFAEGLARNEKYDDAEALAKLGGPTKDKLDACLGAAAVAWKRNKNKSEAARFVQHAYSLGIAKEAGVSDWQRLQFIRLACRVELADQAKEIAKSLKEPYRPRAQLEMVLATCDRSTDAISAEALQDLGAGDQAGTTFALAWLAFAEHNARHGQGRDRIRKAFEDQTAASGAPVELIDRARPLVDVGVYLGSK